MEHSAALASKGAFVSDAWVAEMARGGQVARTVAQAFAHWLKCDIAVAGRPCLPPAVDAMHKRVLAGPFVLQVVDWRNIAETTENSAVLSGNRTVRYLLTDGAQTVRALEEEPVAGIPDKPPFGFKLAVRDVEVRHGTMLLNPRRAAYLGGSAKQPAAPKPIPAASGVAAVAAVAAGDGDPPDDWCDAGAFDDDEQAQREMEEEAARASAARRALPRSMPGGAAAVQPAELGHHPRPPVPGAGVPGVSGGGGGGGGGGGLRHPGVVPVGAVPQSWAPRPASGAAHYGGVVPSYQSIPSVAGVVGRAVVGSSAADMDAGQGVDAAGLGVSGIGGGGGGGDGGVGGFGRDRSTHGVSGRSPLQPSGLSRSETVRPGVVGSAGAPIVVDGSLENRRPYAVADADVIDLDAIEVLQEVERNVQARAAAARDGGVECGRGPAGIVAGGVGVGGIAGGGAAGVSGVVGVGVGVGGGVGGGGGAAGVAPGAAMPAPLMHGRSAIGAAGVVRSVDVSGPHGVALTAPTVLGAPRISFKLPRRSQTEDGAMVAPRPVPSPSVLSECVDLSMCDDDARGGDGGRVDADADSNTGCSSNTPSHKVLMVSRFF